MNDLKIIDHIVTWIKAYCINSKIEGLVIGVSGGIDSAVTSVLSARTGLPLLCVEMPIHQSKDQVFRAKTHIESLKSEFDNVSSIEIDLSAVFDQMVSVFPKIENLNKEEISLVNTRARLRMTTLYYFASINNAVVVGTGNQVEDFGIGFFTKYGDGGVDISPIADLNKTKVFSLGKELGVSEEILNALPTDGLWGDDRTDEDQIGATYPELEWAMNYLNNPSEMNLNMRQKEVLRIFNSMHLANKHKMEPVPVCLIPEEWK